MVNGLEVSQEADAPVDEEWYYDDKTGRRLELMLVKAAELEELSFMEKMGVGTECAEKECWERLGRAPTSTTFVRVNKGNEEKPDVRCRLCARDFKVNGGEDSERSLRSNAAARGEEDSVPEGGSDAAGVAEWAVVEAQACVHRR